MRIHVDLKWIRYPVNINFLIETGIISPIITNTHITNTHIHLRFHRSIVSHSSITIVLNVANQSLQYFRCFLIGFIIHRTNTNTGSILTNFINHSITILKQSVNHQHRAFFTWAITIILCRLRPLIA